MKLNLLKETKLILRKYNIRPRERLGQNFIVNEEVLQRQVDYAKIKKNDTVLEIGPGIGSLTKVLLENAGKVWVIEKDPEMVNILRARFKGRNLEIIEGDALKVELPRFDKIVSNIPYSISSPLTFRLLQASFKTAVLTYQKEFARRMIAEPGTREYSRLSIATYYYAKAEILEILKPEVFYPRPEVESAIVRLTPKEKPFEVDETLFFKTLRALFTQRKKTVKKALIHSSGILGIQIKRRHWRLKLEKAIPEDMLNKRVFQLKPEEVAEICNILRETI